MKKNILILLIFSMSFLNAGMFSGDKENIDGFSRSEFFHWARNFESGIYIGVAYSEIYKTVKFDNRVGNQLTQRFATDSTGIFDLTNNQLVCYHNTRSAILTKEFIIDVHERNRLEDDDDRYDFEFGVDKNTKSCVIIEGLWYDDYNDEYITDANDIDIDHVVTLKDAWNSGAYKWDKDQRKIFANDPMNLQITHKSTNRSKGHENITEWMPKENDRITCNYLKNYLSVKVKYSLKLSKNEKEIIKDWEDEDFEFRNGKDSECSLERLYDDIRVQSWSRQYK